jgi:Mg2+ and Co2+ transporter CorA
MNEMSEPEERSEPSQSEVSEEKKSGVYIVNLNKKICRSAEIEEILNPSLVQLVNEEYLFLIHDPTTETIMKIRKAYNLHPILDYECSESNTYSIDHMFKFDDCLFVALIDIPLSEDFLHPATLKVLLIKHVMFIIISERLNCVEEVLSSMGFNIFPNMNDTKDLIQKSTAMMRKLTMARRSAIQLVNQTIGLSETELALYKILHMMFLRIEDIISKMDKEVDSCIDFVSNLSINESNEFIIKINITQKNLSLCKTFVSRKAKMLPDLIKTEALSKQFSEYMISMSLNMMKLEKKIESSKRILNSYANVYNSNVDEEKSKSSKKLNKLLQVFSAITASFLPLNLIAAYMGMNVTVPFQVTYYDTLWPFFTIIMFCGFYLAFVMIVFKLKSWL